MKMNKIDNQILSLKFKIQDQVYQKFNKNIYFSYLEKPNIQMIRIRQAQDWDLLIASKLFNN